MGDRKIKSIKKDDNFGFSVHCCVCDKHEEFDTIAERNRIIRSHAGCIAGDSISFKVSYYVYPVCVAPCGFCGKEADPNSMVGDDVYACDACCEVLQKVN